MNSDLVEYNVFLKTIIPYRVAEARARVNDIEAEIEIKVTAVIEIR